MKTVKRAFLPALLILLAAFIAACASTRGNDAGSETSSPATTTQTSQETASLAGTWVVTIPRPAPQPKLTSLQTYSNGGGLIEMPHESPAARTPQFGSWEHVEGRTYATSGIIYHFDEAGKLAATTKVNRTIELGQDGNSFTFVGRVSTVDTNDNPLGNFVARGTGVRMPIERISDVP